VRAEEIADDREALERTERAEQLRSSLETEEERNAKLADLHEEIANHVMEARAARDAGIALPSAATRLGLIEIPKPSAITKSLTALASHRTKLEELALKSVDADAEATKADGAREIERAGLEVVAKANEEVDTRRAERATATQQLEEARTARDQLPGLERAAAAARERADAATSLTTTRSRFAEAERNAAKAERAAIKARKAAQDLRQRYLDGIAATLAGGLADYQPCPVCGSVVHPALAVAASNAVTKDQLDRADGTADHADDAAKAATEAASVLATEAASLEAKAGTIADDPAAGIEEADRATAELLSATELSGNIESLEELRTALDALLTDLEKNIADANTDVAISLETATAAEGRAAAMRAEIVNALGDGTTPQAALETLDDLIGALDVLARDAEQETPLRAAHTAAIEHLGRELMTSPFTDAQDARSALRDDDVRTDLALRLKQHDDEVVKQQGVLEAPDLADLTDERPDTAAAQAVVVQAEEAYTAAVEHQKGATDAQTELTRLSDEHRTGEAVLGKLRKRANLVSGVADRCAGRVPPKVSLQRWVLAAYLDDICLHANARLEAMTAGRYRLLVHREGERGGSKAGLGLRVRDAFTGEEREVTTLSGGETFQASLALALGVADAVQAQTGGVHLDALFIDEGFGTLDPDNLQLAIDELDRLREGGRMVGVISHVGALHERIRSGIEVIATDRGSTVRVGEIALP
jgi:exonuclease SbcC